MKDEFYTVLSSNDSSKYFSENNPSNFTVHLPYELQIQGTWKVALVEVQYPQTLLHISQSIEENWIEIMVSRIAQVKEDDLSNYLRSPAQIEIMEVEEPAFNLTVKLKISHGNYKSLEDILNEINNLNFINDHLKFEINTGGFVKIVKKSKENVSYSISMSKHIRNIFGLISEKNIYMDNKNQFTFPYPASLNNGLPSALYVYTDICEPYITGILNLLY